MDITSSDAAQSAIKRIAVSQLRVGMYIADLNNQWIPDNNLRRHGLILRDVAVEQIKQLGVTHVYIDTRKGKDCAAGIPLAEVQAGVNDQIESIHTANTEHLDSVPMAEELDQAKQLRSEALNLLADVMSGVREGRMVSLRPVEDMADSIAESIRRNQSALSYFTRIRSKDQYLLEHSFSVAVLMGVLARALGFNNDDLHELVTGGLLHDVGKIRVDDAILHKPGSLTPEEWAEMKRHVTYGEEVLEQTNTSRRIRQICAQHHERLDGTGYPRGLSQSAITLHGRMAAVVDVFDAITAHRCYHNGMTPTQAMKKLLEWTDNHLDRAIVYQFIGCMSIYPAGALVALSSGEYAFVHKPNRRQPHLPVVNVVWDSQARRPLTPHLIDLSSRQGGRRVSHAVNPDQVGLRLEDFS